MSARPSQSVVPYWERLNDEVFCGVVIEDPEALDHLEDIASADGVDGLFFGPFDLAVRMSKRVGDVSQEAVSAKYSARSSRRRAAIMCPSRASRGTRRLHGD